ncbi:hypothetical protein [Parabacteroides sp. PF5-9]|uniref:hypothetical protein n=1 Tax=Parabacteroides sp. PF5-9 TaxID=1742404 RepID=UPI0024752165|nr:hypothetical protein [Parabacteroides sp. PF5-9]MDH6357509.1 hypothetical protein [Parabacteroides sp. PF5-9]
MKKLRANYLLKALLLVLYIGFYVGNTTFVHTHHYLSYSVTHSHPFLKTTDGVPDHGHDKASLDTIDQINTIVIDFVLFLFALGIVGLFFTTLIQQPRSNIVFRVVNGYNLRAPPLFS